MEVSFLKNNINWSIPWRMVFKRYYCSKCGSRLKREKTHRIVTKDDIDYFKYHEYNTFPRRDHDVYEYRFKCPSCESRMSFEEQCIVDRIQKVNRRKLLSDIEIKKNYDECKKFIKRKAIFYEILIILLAIFIVGIFCFLSKDSDNIISYTIACSALLIYTTFRMIKTYKPSSKNKTTPKLLNRYDYEKESLLKKLHTYSTHNKSMVEKSDKCYCFHCQKSFDKNEITDYTDNGKTAICPHCGIDSVLPDSIDEDIDEKIISEMNKYWF